MTILTFISGMENPIYTFATPTIISGDRQNVDVIAHELAHSWSGNLVSNASWEHLYVSISDFLFNPLQREWTS